MYQIFDVVLGFLLALQRSCIVSGKRECDQTRHAKLGRRQLSRRRDRRYLQQSKRYSQQFM